MTGAVLTVSDRVSRGEAADGIADEGELLGVVRERLTLALPLLKSAGPSGDRLARRWLEE